MIVAFWFWPGCSGEVSTASDEEAIRTVIRQYEGAVNSADAEGVLALYADNAIWMPDNVPPVVGKTAIRRRVEGAFREITLAKRWHVHEVVVSGDWGFARATGGGTVTEKLSGRQIVESHNELFILHREPAGSWKIARFIYNSDTPPAQPVAAQHDPD